MCLFFSQIFELINCFIVQAQILQGGGVKIKILLIDPSMNLLPFKIAFGYKSALLFKHFVRDTCF